MCRLCTASLFCVAGSVTSARVPPSLRCRRWSAPAPARTAARSPAPARPPRRASARCRPARRRASRGPSRCRRRSRSRGPVGPARRPPTPRPASGTSGSNATSPKTVTSPGRPSTSTREALNGSRRPRARSPSAAAKRPTAATVPEPNSMACGRTISIGSSRVGVFEQRASSQGLRRDRVGRAWRRGRARRACSRGRPGRCRRCRTPCRGRRWCGRTGRPTVTLTPVSKPMSLIGMWPWSWYWTTTMSKRPCRACMNTVSGGHGPDASMPSARAASTAGAITSRSSVPNRPASPACGFSPATATRGVVDPELAQRAVGEPDDGQLALGLHAPDGLGQRDVRADVDDAQLVGDEHHRVVAHAGQLGEDLGVAGVAEAGEVHRLLVQRRGGDGVDLVGQRQLDRPLQVAEGAPSPPRASTTPNGRSVGQVGHGQHVDHARLEARRRRARRSG